MAEWNEETERRLEAQSKKSYTTGKVELCEVAPADIRAALARVKELEEKLAQENERLRDAAWAAAWDEHHCGRQPGACEAYCEPEAAPKEER